MLVEAAFELLDICLGEMCGPGFLGIRVHNPSHVKQLALFTLTTSCIKNKTKTWKVQMFSKVSHYY